MTILDRIGLTDLVARTEGRPEVAIGLIDGPVVMDHPDFQPGSLRAVPGGRSGSCRRDDSLACAHGTFVAGMLSARRGGTSPALCPGCAVLVRPIFDEGRGRGDVMPGGSPEELAAAIVECLDAGARVMNLSIAVVRSSAAGRRALAAALDLAARRGALVVAAAGNQGTLGASALTAHPWVIPVAACRADGRPTDTTNLGRSIGTRGLLAPGEGVTSLAAGGPAPSLRSGTSVAAPFVTGAAALLWSEFPSAVGAAVRAALVGAPDRRRARIVPPLMDVSAAYQALRTANLGGEGGTYAAG
jgi:subtilisin family serine protease